MAEIAGLLHDYASVLNRDWQADHHTHGARLARELLAKYQYPDNKIENVAHCIISHRASKDIKRETIEAEILASADAMAHIMNVISLLNYAYVQRNLGIDEGAAWVLAKIKRSWKKMMPEAREILKDKYAAIKIVLGSK